MRIMNITNANYKNDINFEGVKEGRKFRRIANKLIPDLKKTRAGDYTRTSGKSQPSLQDRLWSTIYDRAEEIGKDFVTPEDRRLHETLKDYHEYFESYHDDLDAICNGGGHYINHRIDYSI